MHQQVPNHERSPNAKWNSGRATVFPDERFISPAAAHRSEAENEPFLTRPVWYRAGRLLQPQPNASQSEMEPRGGA